MFVVPRGKGWIKDINSRSDINTIVKAVFIVTANFVPLYYSYKYVSFEICIPTLYKHKQVLNP